MIKSTIGSDLDATVDRVFPFLAKVRLHPNWFSLFGLIVSLVGAALFAEGSFRSGALVTALGGFFDLTDGVVARHQGRTSTFGAFLDSTLDRVVDMALLFAIAMYYQGQGEAGLAWLAGFALVATVIVSYSKARAESVVADFKGGWFERAERLVVLMVGAVLGFLPLALAIVAIGSAITAGQRITLAWRKMDALDAGETHGE
jgi:CDP-diacylglycerol--glycerol-3-phosphate 3-phosphatidyltransferase